MSPDGKPIQVNANVLQAAAAQNAVGKFLIHHWSKSNEYMKKNWEINTMGPF